MRPISSFGNNSFYNSYDNFDKAFKIEYFDLKLLDLFSLIHRICYIKHYGTWNMEHPELGNTIPVPHECSDLCYFLHATILSALCFFSSIAGVLRAHASGALHHLALLGGEKNNAEENRRLTKI